MTGCERALEAMSARMDGALAASVFHFGELTIGEVKRHMKAAGLAVRMDGITG